MLTLAVEGVAVEADQRSIHRGLLERAHEVSRSALRGLINGVLDDEVTEALQRPPRTPRERSGEHRLRWSCGRCGNDRARDFERDGHYRRQLQTTFGSLVDVRIPMLECKACKGAAAVEFAALPKHKQLWLDVDVEVIFAYGAEEGLRHIGERIGAALGWPVSAGSIQRRVHHLSKALDAWRRRQVTDPPDVLMIDGIWFTVMEPTEERYTDAVGRNRPRLRKQKRVAIIALGLWSETGRQEVLDFEIAKSEDETSCVELLNRLHDRGVTEATVKLVTSDGAEGIIAAIETVYPTVDRQRCIFHKLRNMSDHVLHKAHRAELLRAAAQIYKADSADEARARYQMIVEQWLAGETEAVASLTVDFEASIAYLAAPGIAHPHRFKTTNAIEGGVMRPLRKKLDHATLFQTQTGADVAIFLSLSRLNARQRDQPWRHQANDILEELLMGGYP